jgi:hypothetical protein
MKKKTKRKPAFEDEVESGCGRMPGSRIAFEYIPERGGGGVPTASIVWSWLETQLVVDAVNASGKAAGSTRENLP